ncbi:MAG: hypothetical protein AVDCRST_MAG47-2369, partial [uncultured Nocardioidaceae bacterium]
VDDFDALHDGDGAGPGSGERLLRAGPGGRLLARGKHRRLRRHRSRPGVPERPAQRGEVGADRSRHGLGRVAVPRADRVQRDGSPDARPARGVRHRLL